MGPPLVQLGGHHLLGGIAQPKGTTLPPKPRGPPERRGPQTEGATRTEGATQTEGSPEPRGIPGCSADLLAQGSAGAVPESTDIVVRSTRSVGSLADHAEVARRRQPAFVSIEDIEPHQLLCFESVRS